jgi:TetR/AcrR family transcriptional repressor of nem operon
MMRTLVEQPLPATKRKLLDAATNLMLRQGYTATTVDQVCTEAGVTKGSFFHYFKSKEQMGAAAIDFFTCCQQDAHAEAPFNEIKDPLERLFGMLDFCVALATDPAVPKACLVGNLAQELSETNKELRACCEESFNQWTDGVAALLNAARNQRKPARDFDPENVATLMLSLLQGSFLVARVRQDPDVIAQNLHQCRDYLTGLFTPKKRGEPHWPTDSSAPFRQRSHKPGH